MQLGLNEDQTLLVDSFEKFFEEESSIERVRAAEATGFDPALWAAIGSMGLLAMRVPGDAEFSLFDTALIAEIAGKYLASVPLVEGILAARLLAAVEAGEDLLESLVAGTAVIVFFPKEPEPGVSAIIPGGAVADGVVFLSGDELRYAAPETKAVAPQNHADQAPADWVLVGENAVESRVLASGSEWRRCALQAFEEWKLLTAAMLNGLSRQSVMMAAQYVSEREQFGRPVGSFQGVAHPLADRITDIEGSRLLLWSAIEDISDGSSGAAARISMAYWWAAKSSSDAVQRALHSFGGYGLTNEYDIQLYHRRAKGLSLVLGDPADELLKAGKRAWCNADTVLPDAGMTTISFSLGDEAQAFAEETRQFFKEHITPEWQANSHYSYDGHDWALNRKMGLQKLLFPTWEKEFGGRGADRYVGAAAMEVWDAFGVTSHAQSVSNMVGKVIAKFGTDELKARYLPAIAAGEEISCLGYSEPSSGSDSFAARTKAVRDGDHWVINGQKMFTSGGNLASHVLLLTRTDPDAPKHAGLTLFVIPMDAEGIEVHPVHTYQEERTNATFYTDVRVPDWCRIGEVNDAARIFGWALSLEQGGAGFYGPHRGLVEACVEWGGSAVVGGRPALENDRVLERMARCHTHALISKLLYYRTLWLLEEGITDRAAGPMSKVFSSETFLRDATDLFDLTAPRSLLRGRDALGEIELAARHASATTIYAGTSEVHRSQIAEKALGLPRSR